MLHQVPLFQHIKLLGFSHRYMICALSLQAEGGFMSVFGWKGRGENAAVPYFLAKKSFSRLFRSLQSLICFLRPCSWGLDNRKESITIAIWCNPNCDRPFTENVVQRSCSSITATNATKFAVLSESPEVLRNCQTATCPPPIFLFQILPQCFELHIVRVLLAF